MQMKSKWLNVSVLMAIRLVHDTNCQIIAPPILCVRPVMLHKSPRHTYYYVRSELICSEIAG